MNLTRVYLESPFAGDTVEEVRENINYARKCLKDCLNRGEAPFASHLLYTQDGVLEDTEPSERSLGINAGFQYLNCCEKSVVYTDKGISPGMRKGIRTAEELNIPVEYRRLDEEV